LGKDDAASLAWAGLTLALPVHEYNAACYVNRGPAQPKLDDRLVFERLAEALDWATEFVDQALCAFQAHESARSPCTQPAVNVVFVGLAWLIAGLIELAR
jgi:hypothetical protein